MEDAGALVFPEEDKDQRVQSRRERRARAESRDGRVVEEVRSVKENKRHGYTDTMDDGSRVRALKKKKKNCIKPGQ